ncbi:hypothetical protein PF010_g25076 [Phytophthora fragariae]|nr:hypothetical protein PF010_g25076 [Phytophthora fragariae]
MAGDVASAYRNVCTHSECVYMFAGHIPEDTAIVIDLAAAFGWTGSSGTYGVLGGAVAFAHGSTTNATTPADSTTTIGSTITSTSRTTPGQTVPTSTALSDGP